jgi:hypothetical protein
LSSARKPSDAAARLKSSTNCLTQFFAEQIGLPFSSFGNLCLSQYESESRSMTHQKQHATSSGSMPHKPFRYQLEAAKYLGYFCRKETSVPIIQFHSSWVRIRSM